MKESVSWTSSRPTIRLLNLRRPQLNRAVQFLTGHCNLQRHKKTTGCAESSLCPKCSLEDETPNHHVGNRKLYQDIRVKYFGIDKTTVHDVVTKCSINKLATYCTSRKLEGFLSSTSTQTKLQQRSSYSCNEPKWGLHNVQEDLPNGSESACTAAH